MDAVWSAMRFRRAELVKLSPTSTRHAIGTGAAKAKREPARPVETPEDLAAALGADPQAAAYFSELAPSHRKAYIEWITGAKRAETRQNRVVETVEKLKHGLKRPSDKA
ncbi:YdeI/OmpD-associated family protein [Paenibacillus macerans]|uniref:YdeI/OmpD-associated family protein n=1 Tax=Paenibacillus macerans TaxID=44252 RepID=UPI003D30F83D